MEYRCVATSVVGFIQQLSSNYLTHGYWFHVTGRIPDGKTPESVDKKLIEKYEIGVSRQTRARRKRRGEANVHYLRHDRFFVLLATHGHHRFYQEEVKSFRDVRKAPIHFAGYSITCKRGGYLRKDDPEKPAVPDDKYRVRVQIGREPYRDLLAYFVEMATRRRAETLGRELYNVPYEPYAPVRRQMLNILRQVNKARRHAGYELVKPDVLRYRRRIVKPFDPAQGPWRGGKAHSAVGLDELTSLSA